MVAAALRTFVSGASVFALVSLFAFGLMALAPGDPARMALSASGLDTPTPEEVAAKRAALKLDQPLPMRYLNWFVGVMRGNFGSSYRTAKPVYDMYLERLPATLLFAACTLAATFVIALPCGIFSALYRGKWQDAWVQGMAVFSTAVPNFWLALILILIFAATLNWLPALGSATPAGLVLPAIVAALPNIATQSRLIRAATLDALSEDYLLTAYAKGLGRYRAILRHAMPNIMASVCTALAIELAYLLTGSIVIETVFAYPGVGRLAVEAALIGDMPVLAICVLAAAGVYIFCNGLADMALAWLDPRVTARKL